jgi:hypothetical protein
MFLNECMEIIGYTDIYFVEDANDWKSKSFHEFLLGGTTISWLSEKHDCVVMHTVKVQWT